ncbi:MAG TPA: hypothetical protein VLH86_00215 [Patescibacteria group bacterium]|nr:hypothetical protein [Patescibacteria group bacterium]
MNTAQPPLTGTFPNLSQPQQPPKKDRHKLFQLILIISASLLGVLVMSALVWALLPKKKAPVVQTPKTTSSFYYVDSYKADPNAAGGYIYGLGFIDPASTKIPKANFKTPLAPTGATPLQFSADGKKYVYGVTDHKDSDSPNAQTPNAFQLRIGNWPQNPTNDKTIAAENSSNPYRDWLLTADGKEVVYISTTLATDKTPISQVMYSIDVDSGKATKIGDISRPIDRDNTRLFEVVKDSTVSFYTSQNDGIYQTTYDRRKHTVAQNKVVIKGYDTGVMGMPSPDGTKMIYFGGTAGAGDFTVYLFDLKEGGITPLLDTPAKYGGYSNGYWSPDSKLIILTSSVKDVDGTHYKNQLLTVDTVTKSTKTDVLAENTVSAADNAKSTYNATSWSPDGRYITFIQNSLLYFYDTKERNILPTSNTGYTVDPTHGNVAGWLTKVE